LAASPFRLPGRDERARLLAILERPAPEAARALLGHLLVRRRGTRVLRARIVETEAYLPRGDPGAHVFRGPSPRVRPLYGPPGTVYVYFVYGMHHCLNLAVDAEGIPGCVLVRAAEILGDGEVDGRAARGPGLLCRTLGLTVRQSGRSLFAESTGLTLREGWAPRRVLRTPRIGLRRGAERRLRFVDAESGAVSRRRPGGLV
jgi:DNA-3-methyladenine glycosylase